jgi:hypothetical protein
MAKAKELKQSWMKGVSAEIARNQAIERTPSRRNRNPSPETEK